MPRFTAYWNRSAALLATISDLLLNFTCQGKRSSFTFQERPLYGLCLDFNVNDMKYVAWFDLKAQNIQYNFNKADKKTDVMAFWFQSERSPFFQQSGFFAGRSLSWALKSTSLNWKVRALRHHYHNYVHCVQIRTYFFYGKTPRTNRLCPIWAWFLYHQVLIISKSGKSNCSRIWRRISRLERHFWKRHPTTNWTFGQMCEDVSSDESEFSNRILFDVSKSIRRRLDGKNFKSAQAATYGSLLLIAKRGDEITAFF